MLDINKIMSIGLYGRDIQKMLNNDVNILSYDSLFNINNIDELFLVSSNVVILYQIKKNYGHWVCLYKKNDTIYFFDSYGFIPDDELKYSYKKTYSYLLYLFDKSNYKIDYSNYELQEKSPNISTCGRWCVERLKYKEYSHSKFAKIFYDMSKKYNLKKDEIVTLLNIYT